MNGKGSKTRPCGVSKKQFDKNWDRVFKRKPAEVMLNKSKFGNCDHGQDFVFTDEDGEVITCRCSPILVAVTDEQFKHWKSRKIYVQKNE